MVQKILFKNKIMLALLLVLLVVSSATNAISAIIFMIVWNAMMNVGPFTLPQAFIIFIIMDTFTALVGHTYKIVKNAYIQNGICQLREEVFSSLIEDHHQEEIGTKISILNHDIGVIDESYLNGVFRFLNICFTIIMSGITFFVLSWQMALITIFTSVITLFIPNLLSSKMKEKQEKLSKSNEDIVSMTNDYFTGSFLIHAFQVKDLFVNNFNRESALYKKNKLSFLNSISLAESTSNFLGVVIFGTTMLIGAWMVHMNLLQMGVFIAAIQLTNSFSYPVTMAIQEYVKINASKPIIDKMNSILNIEIEDYHEKQELDFTNISLKNVSYSYDSKNNVLDHINLEIEKGKKYFIMGESGCGKTTLLNILCHKLNDYQGEVLFGNEQLSRVNQSVYKKIFSIVDQNVFIFNDTLRNNLTLYKDFDEKEIIDVLKKVNLSSKISLLDQSLEENGKILSGGEKQRIAIARALLHQSQILVLDEAISSLDSIMANEIENLITSLNEMTIISVSHRVSEKILYQYDKVIVLENGKMTYCDEYHNEKDHSYIKGILQLQLMKQENEND